MGSLSTNLCAKDLYNLFKSTYYPVFRTKCATCHENGPGTGTFAASNSESAFSSFFLMGRSRVEANFISESHKPPYTGTVNKPLVDANQSNWQLTEAAYTQCASSSAEPLPPVGGAIAMKSTEKGSTGMIAAPNTWVPFEYDLDTEVMETANRGKVKLIARIEVRVMTVDGVQQGYEVRNPSFRLKTGTTGTVRPFGMKFTVNGRLLNSTTYEYLEPVVNSTVAGVISASVSPLFKEAVDPADPTNTTGRFIALKTTDKFGIAFSEFANAAGVSLLTGTKTKAALTTGVTQTFVQLTSATGLFTTRCASCHRAGNNAAKFSITDYAAVTVRMNNIVSRINNTTSPMPQAGLIPQNERDIIENWVNAGGPYLFNVSGIFAGSGCEIFDHFKTNATDFSSVDGF